MAATDVEIQLKKFDVSKIEPDAISVIIGKRHSGKSWLVKDILYHKRNVFPFGMVISGTEQMNRFYRQFSPSITIDYEYNEEKVADMLHIRQRKMAKKFRKCKEEYAKAKGYDTVDNLSRDEVREIVDTKLNPYAFLVMDDVLDKASDWNSNENIKTIFVNGRHYCIFYLLVMQYPLGIGPSLRGNVDYVFICREPNVNNRRKLYEYWAGIFPTFDVFNTVMDQSTNNYDCLVINNRIQSNKLEDIVYWYHADSNPAFRLCAERFWEHSDGLDQSDDDENEEEAPLDLKTYMDQRKKGPNLVVERLR